MAHETSAGRVIELPPGAVRPAGSFAVGNREGEYFAVSRRCRHLRGDLGRGSIDNEGCLVCPWHGARYDVNSGRMVSGPKGFYGKIPGLGAAFKLLTKYIPLGRGKVIDRDGELFVSQCTEKK